MGNFSKLLTHQATGPNPFQRTALLLTSPTALIGLLLVLLIWSAMGWHLATTMDEREAAVRSQSQRLANALQMQVSQVLESVDIALITLSRQLADDSTTAQEVQQILEAGAHALPNSLSLILIDAEGKGLAASEAGYTPGTSYLDREYFRVHTEKLVAGSFIGGPITGKVLGKKFFPISRRIEAADGRFIGVLMVALEPKFFARIFEEFPQGSRGAIALANTQTKQIVARAPGHDKHFGQDISKSKLFTGLLDNTSGVYEVPTTTDGTTRIIGYHQVERAPMVMLVGYAREDLHDEFSAMRNAYIATGLLVALLIAIQVWQVLRTHHQTLEKLAIEEELNQARQREGELLRDKNRALESYIGDLELADKSLQEKQYFLENLIENSGALIYAKDCNGTYRLLNHEHERLIGLPRAQILGKTDEMFFPPEIADQVRRHELIVMTTKAARQFEEYHAAPDGMRHFISLKFPLLDQAAQVTGVCGITTEITARKRIEIELQQAKAAAESANLAKSQFLATMSHEIRTPLNGVLGMAQILMMDGIDDAERKEFARTIMGSGKTLLTLLNDILDLSKIEAGKLDLISTEFDPAAMIRETSALFAEMAQLKSITISSDLVRLPARLESDPIRLRQMLSNYLSNAIKFSDKGIIRVSASIVENAELEQAGTVAPEVVVEFSVEDNGCGISDEDQKKLFRPFVQVDGSATRRYEGSGLGLSIVARLAERMGGGFGVESQLGKGSRFWFRIRARLLSEQANVRKHPREARAYLSGKSAQSGFTVLVVEDNQLNRTVIGSILSKLGYSFAMAENGQDALALIEHWQGPPAGLILMDCQMPVLDGFATTLALRQREQALGLPRQPIIALTAKAFAEDRELCLASGMDEVLTKPVDINLLSAILRRLSRKASEANENPAHLAS